MSYKKNKKKARLILACCRLGDDAQKIRLAALEEESRRAWDAANATHLAPLEGHVPHGHRGLAGGGAHRRGGRRGEATQKEDPPIYRKRRV